MSHFGGQIKYLVHLVGTKTQILMKLKYHRMKHYLQKSFHGLKVSVHVYQYVSTHKKRVGESRLLYAITS